MELVQKAIGRMRNATLKLMARLELGHPTTSGKGRIKDCIDVLWQFLKPRLTTRDANGSNCPYHLGTSLHSRNSHLLRAQINLFLALANLVEIECRRELQESLARYVLLKQCSSGIFEFERGNFTAKDEGPATNWAICMLVKAYEQFGDERYLVSATRAAQAARKLLYLDHSGYVHTLGQDFWCPNVSVKFAYANLLLFAKTSRSEYLGWASDALHHTLKYQGSDGLFPYIQSKPSVYLVLYQANIIFFLTLISKEPEVQRNLDPNIRQGLKYLENLVRENGSVAEPDLPMYHSYAISVATTAAVLYQHHKVSLCKRVLSYLETMILPPGPFVYTCSDHKGYWGRYKQQRDIIFSEVLFWLSTMMEQKWEGSPPQVAADGIGLNRRGKHSENAN